VPYVHPNSLDHNSFTFFPEIFEEANIDFQLFLTALGYREAMKPNDYFSASEFLAGSLKTRDINMLFSAVQRLYGYEHKDFPAYLKKKFIRRELLNIKDDDALLAKIERLEKEYNNQYSMSQLLLKFYDTWLDDAGKKALLTKIPLPASLYTTPTSNATTALKRRLDFLIKIRNGIDHAAVYHPLAVHPPEPEYIYVMKDGKEHIFLLFLTFQELYDITKKAMAAYWIAEFKDTYQGNKKTKIDAIIAERVNELWQLNLPKRNADLMDVLESIKVYRQETT
jgi:hypothetical protein